MLDPVKVHETIKEAFKMRDRAYCPYSKFNVGAALLTASGEIVGGCNVENASYGAGVCAERTAIPKAISLGLSDFTALAVCSNVPSPTVSPCGICRQFIREFFPLNTPIIMLSSTYPLEDEPPASLLSALSSHGLIESAPSASFDDDIKIMTLEQLLPMSFGPEQLQ